MESLKNMCLDAMILSHDPEMKQVVWQLPDHFVKMVDKRCKQMEHHPTYIQHFNPTYSDSGEEEEEEYNYYDEMSESSDCCDNYCVYSDEY